MVPLAELLEREKLVGDEVLTWARGRVPSLLAGLEADDELARLLGQDPGTRSPGERATGTLRDSGAAPPPLPPERAAPQGSPPPPTPPIPSAAGRATRRAAPEMLEELDADDLVELDADELEVLEDPADDDAKQARERVDDSLLGSSGAGVDLAVADAEESGTVDTGLLDEDEDDGEFDVDLE